MKKIILLAGVMLVTVSYAGPKVLNVQIGKDRVAAKSDSFQYESGLVRFELGDRPDWIEHVQFLCASFEQELGTGGTTTSWSSSLAQMCGFKIVAKDNASGSERSWQFNVTDERGEVLYNVRVVQQVGSKRRPKENPGACSHLKNGDIAMLFNRCGGVLKSNPVKNEKWPWCVDTSKMPDWIRFLKMESNNGQKQSFARNDSGGKNGYSISFNGGAECSFIVMTDENTTGMSRKWLLPVNDERGQILFWIAIDQK